MTIEDEDRRSLIRYRLKQADETVEDVQLLIDNERLRSAVNRIYYGMFYSILALGSAYQFETSRHSQLIGWFNRNFVQTGIFDAKYGKIVNKAFNRRTKGDYDSFIEFEKEIVFEMFTEMEEFIAAIKSHLNK